MLSVTDLQTPGPCPVLPLLVKDCTATLKFSVPCIPVENAPNLPTKCTHTHIYIYRIPATCFGLLYTIFREEQEFEYPSMEMVYRTPK